MRNEIISSDIPYPSLNFPSPKLPNRLSKKINFSFSTFSAQLYDAVDNYNQLETFLKHTKPRYYKKGVAGVYQYNNLNTRGSIRIYFNGFIEVDQYVAVNMTNFSYEINEELGYVYYDGEQIKKNPPVIGNKGMYPIGFKLSIEGVIPYNAYESVDAYENWS